MCLGEIPPNRLLNIVLGFPGGSVSKESTCNAGDPSSNQGLGRSPGKGNGNFSTTLAWKSQDREAWWATVHEVTRVGHNSETKPLPQSETITAKVFRRSG